MSATASSTGLEGDENRAVSNYDTCIVVGLISLVIFTPLAYGAVQPRSIAWFECIAGVAGLCYLLKVLRLGKFSHIHTPVDLFFALIIGYAFLQLLFPLIPGLKGLGLRSISPQATRAELLRLISYGLIFYLTLNTIITRRRLTRLITVIIALGFLMSLLFLGRYFGLKAPRGLINRDHFSAYLTLITPLAIGFLFVPTFRKGRTRPAPVPHIPLAEQRLLIFFSILVMSAALSFTLSRGGLAGLIGAFAVMAVLVRSKKLKRYLLPVTAICIALMVGWIGKTVILERLGTVKGEVLSGRLAGRVALWKATLEVIRDYPLSGTGVGTFQHTYISPEPGIAAVHPIYWSHAHNDFLELLTETGIPVFLLLGAFGLYLLVYFLKRFNSRSDPWTLAISTGLFGSLAGILIHSITDFSLEIPAISILLVIELALLVTILNLGPKNSISSRKEFLIPRTAKVFLYSLSFLLAVIFVVLSIKPAVADYYYRRALQNDAESAELLEKAVRFDTLNALYHYELGGLYQREDLNSAFSEYRKAVELDPRNGKYRQSLAWTYSRLADRLYSELKEPSRMKAYIRGAIGEFETAIRLDPQNPYRHRAYARWLFGRPSEENIRKGMAEYRRAIELEPGLAGEGLAEYYKFQKDFRKLIRILPAGEANDYSAVLFIAKEKGFEFAADFAAEHLETYPDNEKLNFFLAVKSGADKEIPWELRAESYSRLFKIAPRNYFYRMRYGEELSRRKDYEGAVANFRKALEMGPDPKRKKRIVDLIERSEKRLALLTGGTD